MQSTSSLVQHASFPFIGFAILAISFVKFIKKEKTPWSAKPQCLPSEIDN